jgi:uncharacterized membrane protein
MTTNTPARAGPDQAQPLARQATSDQRPDDVGKADAGSILVTVGLLGRRLGRAGRQALTTSGGYLAAKAAAGREPARRTLGLGAAEAGGGSRRVAAAITVEITPEEAYRRWRRFEDLPRWFTRLESVVERGGGRSRWRAKAPLGTEVAWEAELTEDRPGEVIAWRSLPGASIANEGRVRFAPAPGDRGTEVRVELRYAPPGGPLGVAAAKLTGEEPGRQVHDALRRFKQVIETGEIPTTEGQPSGRAPVQSSPETEGSTTMGERTIPEQDREGKMAPAVGPQVVREDQVTQGTEVANLPHAGDIVGEASEESFPTSDPPAYTGRKGDQLEPTTEANS